MPGPRTSPASPASARPLRRRTWRSPRKARRLGDLRDALEAGLKAISPSAVVFGAGHERVPNTTLFAVPGVKAETAVIALDLEGVAVSSGAACSSGKVAASHVLAAMGVAPELVRGAIRLSIGFSTTERDDRTVSQGLGQARNEPI